MISHPVVEIAHSVYADPSSSHPTLWTQRVTRLFTVALAVSGKHATFKSTFWQDAYIFKYLHRINIFF
jgi:hypothetical protein